MSEASTPIVTAETSVGSPGMSKRSHRAPVTKCSTMSDVTVWVGPLAAAAPARAANGTGSNAATPMSSG